MPPNAAPILLILVAVAAAGLLLFPYILVLLIIVGYLCIIPFTIRSQRWVAARPEAWDAKPQAAPRRPPRGATRRAQPPVDGAAGAAQAGRRSSDADATSSHETRRR